MSPAEDASLLAEQAGEELPNDLLKLQVFAVEARYEEGPFALPAGRESLLADLVARLGALEQAIRDQGEAIP